MCFANRNTCQNSSNSNGAKSAKRVRFSDDLEQVRDITHVSQFSQRHLFQCFYRPEEYSYITAENNTILKFMMIGGEGIKQVETATSTTRGLECKTLEGAEQKKIATLDGLCAVLLEQERQKQKNVVDEERIRQAYLAYTQVPAMAALKQGRLDARIHEDALPASQKAGGKGIVSRKSYFKNFSNDDMQSTATTLVSDESNDGYYADGSRGRSRSIVRRLLKGSRLFPSSSSKMHLKKQAAVDMNSSSSNPISHYG
jgi:hypothetical protein